MTNPTSSTFIVGALFMLFASACTPPNLTPSPAPPVPVAATPEKNDELVAKEKLDQARAYLAQDLARGLPAVLLSNPESTTAELANFFGASPEDLMDAAFREAIRLGPANKRAARIAERGHAQLSLAERLSEYSDALLVPSGLLMTTRSQIFADYIGKKFERVAALVAECQETVKTEGGESSTCTELADRLRASDQASHSSAAESSELGACAIPKLADGAIYLSPNARAPIAQLDGETEVTLYPASAPNQPYPTTSKLFLEAVWLDANSGPRMRSRLDLIPGFLWLNPGARVAIVQSDGKDLQLHVDLGPGSKQREYTKDISCSDFLKVDYSNQYLSVTDLASDVTRRGVLELYDGPKGKLVTRVRQEFVSVRRVEGDWTEVSNTSDLGFRGWTKTSALKKASSNNLLIQVLTAETGNSPRGVLGSTAAGFGSNYAEPMAHLAMPLRLAPASEVVLTLTPRAPIRVISRHDEGAWIAVAGLQANNESKHFWLALPLQHQSVSAGASSAPLESDPPSLPH